MYTGFRVSSVSWLESTYAAPARRATSIPANSVFEVKTCEASASNSTSDIWITDPPYADAVNYHELSEFFLAWYEKHLTRLFPDWYSDSRRALAIRGQEEDFRRAMVEAYSNLARHMPDNGMQIVMFTHQDAGVWADLALILWASGLRVTAAWTIATEISSELKKGNYVQGTVLLVLRKNTSDEVAFLSDLVHVIEEEVARQVESMQKVEDKEEPNFSDTDYQLAAYAAALRVLTSYKGLEDIDVERELMRARKKNEKGPLETLIENARGVAANYLIPDGLERRVWLDLSASERYYLKALDLESKGEKKAGAFQELAKGLGVRDYESLMGSLKANEASVMTAEDFGDRLLGKEGFGNSPVRHALYAILSAVNENAPKQGAAYLRANTPDYWKERDRIAAILRYLGRFGHTLQDWRDASEKALQISTLVAADHA